MLEVDLVTPGKQLLVGEKVDSITVPADNGEVTILPGHTDYLSGMAPGVISLGTGSENSERLFIVSYGFLEVCKDKVTILAETCEEPSEVDLERAKKAQKEAELKLNDMLTPHEFSKYQRKLQRALIRQQAASNK